MKKLTVYAFTILSIFISASGYSGGSSCALCEDVRAYNEAHPENNYKYYEDYLKEQGLKEHGKSKEEKVKDKDGKKNKEDKKAKEVKEDEEAKG